MKTLRYTSLLLFSSVICAAAHTQFLGSQPKDGETLKHPPTEVRIWFSEPMKVALSTVQVFDAKGKEVDLRDLHRDAKTPSLVHLSLSKDVSPGTYKVIWNAVAQDMHVSKGSFHFAVAP